MIPQRPAAAHCLLTAACAVAPFLASACGGSSPATTRGAPAFVLHDEPGGAFFGAVDITGLDPATLEGLRTFEPSDTNWSEVLAVRTPNAVQPVHGRYDVLEDRIRFTPRYAPVAGQPLEIEFVTPGTGSRMDTVMVIDGDDTAEPTRVVAVYPALDTVPMNLLRAYIRFSAPMSEGEAYRRIRLLDAAGDTVPDAFLVLEHELWDPDRTRFTVLFDPGRIKRGLVPNEQLGLPLREGNDYTLAIDGAWEDARGRALTDGHRWSFHAGPADRTSPRVDEWQIVSPSSGSREPAVIGTGEPLDQGLLERLITVHDPDGTDVAGDITVSNGGTRWAFTPADPWRAGDYVLEIGTELEDLAGNNLRHLFDVDRSDRQDTGISGETVRRALMVR